MTIRMAIIGLAVTAVLTGCNEKSVKLDTNEQKASYAIGHQIGQGIKRQGAKVDVDVIAAAISDVMNGKKARLTDDQMRDAYQAMQEEMNKERTQKAEENKKKGADFLEANKKKEGVKTTESGLQYQVITPGKGKSPGEKDRVKVHYKGTLIDGTEFDSSYKRNQPAEFALNRVIKGWTEGLQLMKPGAKYKFFIPSDLAYGPRDRPSIPGNSVLVFEVELLEVLKK